MDAPWGDGPSDEGVAAASASTWQALPPLVQREALFPYLDGGRFAERLRVGGTRLASPSRSCIPNAIPMSS